MTSSSAPSRITLVERILLVVTLLAKVGCLLRQRERMIGFEVGDHLGRVIGADWWAPPLKTTYYGYHPPFGFAIPHLLIEWKVQETFALQIFSTLCSVVAFLSLRMTLRCLGQLGNPVAILFLYFWAGIPILVNCGVSINLDIAILACASLALWFSIAIWKEGLYQRSLSGIALVLTLICAPMIKYNGVILFSIPPLVALFFHQGNLRKLIARVAAAGFPSIVAVVLLLPYYYERYYVETQSFFPRNNEYWNPDHIKRWQDIRDENLNGFFYNLCFEGWIDADQPAEYRHTGLMLADSWKDFWIEDYRLYLPVRAEGENVRPSGVLAGSIYRWLANLLVSAGLCTCVWKWNWEPFNRLGVVFFAIAALHVAALAYYCYLEADPICDATKGIYILPATWLAAFLCVQPLRLLRDSALQRIFPYAACLLVAWLAWNHLWPVY